MYIAFSSKYNVERKKNKIQLRNFKRKRETLLPTGKHVKNTYRSSTIRNNGVSLITFQKGISARQRQTNVSVI
jgi:hypothetical protein